MQPLEALPQVPLVVAVALCLASFLAGHWSLQLHGHSDELGQAPTVRTAHCRAQGCPCLALLLGKHTWALAGTCCIAG
jgi:hypothetical protein